MKISLTNGSEFEPITNGIIENSESILLVLKSEKETVGQIMELFGNSELVKSIEVKSDTGETIRSPYDGFTELKYVKLIPSAPIDDLTTVRAMEILLEKKSISSCVTQNTADIAYIAMESGVEI